MLKTQASGITESAGGRACRFLRREQVQDLTGLPTSTIYELMDRGEFPRPIPITPRRVAWLENDIADWQKAKIAAAARQPEVA